MTKRFFLLLNLTAAVLATAAVCVYLFAPQTEDFAKKPLMPHIRQTLAHTAAIAFSDANGTLTVTSNDDGVVSVMELQNYPVSTQKRDDFLRLVENFKTDEKATALPAFYHDEGLTEDDACRITFMDDRADALTELFVGRQTAKGDGFYMRTKDDPQTYVVKTTVNPCPRAPTDWIDVTLFHFNKNDVKTITYIRPAESGRYIRLSKTANGDFETNASDSYYNFFDANDAADLFSSFKFTDFRRFDPREKPVLIVETVLENGLKIIRSTDGENAASFVFDALPEADAATDAFARRMNDAFAAWQYYPAVDAHDALNPFLETESSGD